jgi:sec-independent protein translocase protein TatB
MDKIFLILIVAVIIIGPHRLPEYAAKLAGFVKSLRRMADQAKERMSDELGPDFDDVDWKKLDPRQYDPRRIVRQALLDDEPTPVLRKPSTRESTPEP